MPILAYAYGDPLSSVRRYSVCSHAGSASSSHDVIGVLRFCATAEEWPSVSMLDRDDSDALPRSDCFRTTREEEGRLPYVHVDNQGAPDVEVPEKDFQAWVAAGCAAIVGDRGSSNTAAEECPLRRCTSLMVVIAVDQMHSL